MKQNNLFFLFCLIWLFQDEVVIGAEINKKDVSSKVEPKYVRQCCPGGVVYSYNNIASIRFPTFKSASVVEGTAQVEWSDCITPLRVNSDYVLPSDDTIQPLVTPLLVAVCSVRSMSLEALNEYDAWMRKKVPLIINRIAQIQQKVLEDQCLQHVNECVQQVDKNRLKLEKDIVNLDRMQADICGVTYSATLGVSTVASITAALLSHYECHKLKLITVALYARYMWWQWSEHQQCMRWCTDNRTQTKILLENYTHVAEQLKNPDVVTQSIKNFFEEKRCKNLNCAAQRLESYCVDEKHKLGLWKVDQERFIAQEEIFRRALYAEMDTSYQRAMQTRTIPLSQVSVDSIVEASEVVNLPQAEKVDFVPDSKNVASKSKRLFDASRAVVGAMLNRFDPSKFLGKKDTGQ